MNADGQEHVVSGVEDGSLVLGFEDLQDGGDKDFNDVMLSLDIGPANIEAVGTDTIQGGPGDDTITGRGGDDVIDGGTGNDTDMLTASETASDSVYNGGTAEATSLVVVRAEQHDDPEIDN